MLTLALALLLPAHAHALPFEIFLYGEKPGLAKPFPAPQGKALRLHLARDGFVTFALRFPEEAPTLAPLEELALAGTKFAGEPTTVRAYALGVQEIEKSSFRNGPGTVAEVPEIAVPNEWLSKPGFHIPAKRIPKRPVYLIELHAPEKAGAGDFQARLHFSRRGQEIDLPLQLRIHKFVLPKHFKLKTSFGFMPYGALIKHFGKWADRETEINDAYVGLAGENRVDLHKIYTKFPKPGAPAAGTDLLSAPEGAGFLKFWGRARSGQLNPYGFGATTTDLPVPEEEKKQPTEGFWKALESSTISHDLLDHSFVYFVDEPEPKTFPSLREKLKPIRGWAPQLQFLVTTDFRRDLEGTFNLWCPNLIHWNRPGFASPTEYEDRRQNHGEHYWIYTSCSAHGCGPAVDENVADLVIDRPAAYARAFAWSAYVAKAEGILYYNTVEAYGHGELAPWHEPFLFHGNGEGNLFYPCTQHLCGIDGVNVVPSLRLKEIRDGLEDVEIFEAGERAGLPVRQWVEATFKGMRSFPKETAEFEKVKVRVLEALEGPSAKK
jgi:hypothetical protein